jgi:hypothetical protein
MSKPYVVRHSWDYKVTVKVPCTQCNEFKPETEVKLHSEYVYGEGYIKLHCCEPCFKKHLIEVRSAVKPTNWGI